MKLQQCTPTGGDCTSGYNVLIDEDCTVKSFVDEVLLNKGEWGSICIPYNECVAYKYGEILSEFPKHLLDLKVISAKAAGGWSRMDYYIKIKSSLD